MAPPWGLEIQGSHLGTRAGGGWFRASQGVSGRRYLDSILSPERRAEILSG